MSRAMLDTFLSDTLAKYQVLYNERQFHNHNAHHLASLFLLGVTDEQLEKAYKTMCKDLDPYEPSPQPITVSNWREFLGNKQYCRSYRDFFNEQLMSKGTDWQKTLLEFLLDNPEQPLINSLVSGLAHPLIHVGYAFEMNSVQVGVEALAMTAVCYNYLHEVIDKLQSPNSPSKGAIDIFKAIRSDARLPIYDKPGVSNLELTVQNCQEQIMFHYNQWRMNSGDLAKAIEELFDLTVYLYGATHKPDQIVFDFFVLHLLTSMHAIRILHSHIDKRDIFEHILFQFFYFATVIYISQLRPEINEQLVNDYPIDAKEKHWSYVIDKTLNTKLVDDAHAVKVVRVLRDAEQLYGDKKGLYLKVAVKTVDNLDTDDFWVGGPNDERQLNVLTRS
jgi:hypothetical protein